MFKNHKPSVDAYLKSKLLNFSHFVDNLLGIDLRRLIKIVFLPKFVKTLLIFWRKGGKINALQPIVSTYTRLPAGSARGGYFHQDLVVANHIFLTNPRHHITVGSRIDGFVAHVASFRPIEVLDIRPLKPSGFLNIKFTQQDILQDVGSFRESTDSLSCLSTMQHLGMGKYGGEIDPDGHIKGFRNLYKILQPKGTLYIGLPLSDQNRVVFNQSRHFHPLDILSWAPDLDLKLIKFDFVNYDGTLYQNADLHNLPEQLIWQGSKERYGYGYFGIYTFQKIAP